MLKRNIIIGALVSGLALPALANEPEVVVEWNSLPYAVKDADTKSTTNAP